jgi:hypothetical protein
MTGLTRVAANSELIRPCQPPPRLDPIYEQTLKLYEEDARQKSELRKKERKAKEEEKRRLKEEKEKAKVKKPELVGEFDRAKTATKRVPFNFEKV